MQKPLPTLWVACRLQHIWRAKKEEKILPSIRQCCHEHGPPERYDTDRDDDLVWNNEVARCVTGTTKQAILKNSAADAHMYSKNASIGAGHQCIGQKSCQGPKWCDSTSWKHP